MIFLMDIDMGESTKIVKNLVDTYKNCEIPDYKLEKLRYNINHRIINDFYKKDPFPTAIDNIRKDFDGVEERNGRLYFYKEGKSRGLTLEIDSFAHVNIIDSFVSINRIFIKRKLKRIVRDMIKNIPADI